MTLFKNDRLLRALAKEPVDATPIWLMRQAGRYLPEYQAVRKKAGSFTNLCKNPELACEVTLQPLRRYPFDAAIIFSDILTIPDAMGLGLRFVENRGPMFDKPIRTQADIEQIILPDSNHLGYVYEAIKLVTRELNGSIPLIGFCGSPWTVAAYMIEGHGKTGFPRAMQMLQSDPDSLHNLLNKIVISIQRHCLEQIKAGASVIMLFDTWGGLLDTNSYQQFSLHYIRQIISGIREHYNKDVPIIIFTKNGHAWLRQMSESGCDALGIDWQITMKQARQEVGDKVAIQGNLHPAKLLESAETIKQAAYDIIKSYGDGAGHIFNLGHGITPDVPPENVGILVEAVHEFSQRYHAQKED